MKRKILSVLGVLMAVLMALTALYACNKTPAGADSSGGSGESGSTEQGGEPSVSESSAENEQRTALFKELNEEYLPLYGILINVEEWNSADRIDIEMFYAWYTDYIAATMQYETRKALYSIDGEPGWHYPTVEFEDFIQKYFYISTKVLRESDVYNKNEDCYTIPVGGWGKNYSFSVVSPDDISISGSTATAKLTCVSNLDSSTIYMYLSLNISESPYKFVGCKLE